ncbi:MAG: hypothetical protein K0Q86_2772, partial [Arthrobacter koreensis]|uniref:hypothetical protein n=1 Tax=Arthrobacter koreensis TaxID=199136 RepID=UPI00240A5F03
MKYSRNSVLLGRVHARAEVRTPLLAVRLEGALQPGAGLQQGFIQPRGLGEQVPLHLPGGVVQVHDVGDLTEGGEQLIELGAHVLGQGIRSAAGQGFPAFGGGGQLGLEPGQIAL